MSKDYVSEATEKLVEALNRNRLSDHFKALGSNSVFEWLADKIGFEEAKSAWKSVVEGAEGK